MDHLPILEEFDRLEGGAEVDLLEKKKPVLAPAVEEVGDVLLERLEAGLAVFLRIEDLGSEGEHELHPAGGVDQTFEQTLARRGDRLSQLADVFVPRSAIKLGGGAHLCQRFLDLLEVDLELIREPMEELQALI
jgi:hypothetical protein